MNANETKSQVQTSDEASQRPWWDVEGLDELPEPVRKYFAAEAGELDDIRADEIAETITQGERNIALFKAIAKRAAQEYQVIRRFYTAARKRLREASSRHGGPPADAIAAGPRHWGDSPDRESSET